MQWYIHVCCWFFSPAQLVPVANTEGFEGDPYLSRKATRQSGWLHSRTVSCDSDNDAAKNGRVEKRKWEKKRKDDMTVFSAWHEGIDVRRAETLA